MAVSAPNASPSIPGAQPGTSHDRDRYQPPTWEIICLACEISSYAPDEDDRPLF